MDCFTGTSQQRKNMFKVEIQATEKVKVTH